MRIEYDEQRGIVVQPDELFDYSAGNECIEKTEAYLKDHGSVQVTIDFRETTFLDSSGIGALLVLMHKLPPQSPSIRIVHPRKSVHKLLEMCHLQSLFEIETESD
jgi:Anti-anti-sigma regulatory factor (antagonist of anti-sigma factor)